jgi:hypothetical protein
MIYGVLVAVIVCLLVYVQFQQVKIIAAEHDCESLLKYDVGLREEIVRLKSTIRLKQNSIEGLYDEIESCVCAESVGCGGKC